jgi:hypothetical protein
LSGRAGRLTKELEGNIFCIQSSSSKWDNKDLFKKEKIELKPTILNKVDRNLKKIESILNDKDISGTDTEKEILKYIANIIKIDSLEIDTNYKSPVITKLIKQNEEKIIELAKSKVEGYEIPASILNCNQTINLDVQNKVYKQLLKDKQILPASSKIDYEACLKVLNDFYELYNWDNAEKRLQKKERLRYYAVLMNQWINGIPLSQIISQTIDWYSSHNKIIYIKPPVPFNKNDKMHINFLIESLIDDIENILRFLLEKYFNHHYQILVKILGENDAGENWATLLEYGTQNRIVIALQNIGFSRNTALKIHQQHKNAITIVEGKLQEVNKSILMGSFRLNSLEYDEVIKVL